MTDSECCKIPHTNRKFWVEKIRRNQERDIEEQKRLAEMGWHCITIWECELKPSVREQTLKSLVYTLNKIWLDDHQAVVTSYPKLEEVYGFGVQVFILFHLLNYHYFAICGGKQFVCRSLVESPKQSTNSTWVYFWMVSVLAALHLRESS